MRKGTRKEGNDEWYHFLFNTFMPIYLLPYPNVAGIAYDFRGHRLENARGYIVADINLDFRGYCFENARIPWKSQLCYVRVESRLSGFPHALKDVSSSKGG